MSHEIRTPLNAILGFTHLLQRSVDDRSHLEKLEKVRAAASHLLQVMNGILEFSKIESGRLVLEDAEFRLQDILDQVISRAGAEAEGKGLQLAADCADDPARSLVLRGDAARLSQILLNYVGNAVKFTDQGSVTVRCRAEEESEADVLLRFEVQDTGIGIDPDKLERLFSAFEQADSSTARRFGGTGLGLAICRRLAGLMGGQVGVRSEPGGGSTFWLTVRLAKAGAAPRTRAAALPAPERTENPGATADIAIPGLDWRTGMRNLRGRRDSYLRLLGQFARAHAGDGAALQASLEVGNTREAQRLAHNLKGVAGTLGAAEVQNLAAALDAALRGQQDGNEIARLGGRLQAALEPLIDGILALPPAEGEGGAAAADPEALKALLDRIRTLAAEDSFGAQEAFREGLPLLRSALAPERLAEIAGHFGNFDYREALAALDRAREEHFGA